MGPRFIGQKLKLILGQILVIKKQKTDVSLFWIRNKNMGKNHTSDVKKWTLKSQFGSIFVLTISLIK